LSVSQTATVKVAEAIGDRTIDSSSTTLEFGKKTLLSQRILLKNQHGGNGVDYVNKN
jgi:hypothetical protein